MSEITTVPDGTQVYYNNGQAINAKTGAAYTPASPVTTTPIGTPAPSVTTTPTQPSVQPTVLSSDKSSAIADNNAKLAAHTNTGTYTDQAGFLRYNDDTSLVTAPMNAIPNGSGGWEAGGMTYAAPPSFIPGDDPETKAQNSIIGQLMTNTDSSTRAQISSITNQYNQLIQQQQTVNASQNDSINQTLIQGGSSRYAPISSAGVIAATTSYGLQKIAALVSEEQGLIQAAKTAQATGNQNALQKALDAIDKTKAAKVAAAKTVSDNLAKANQDLADKKMQQTTDSAIAALYTAGTKDPATIVKNLSAQGITVTAKDVGDAIKALYPDTSKDLPASAQEYEYAKKNGYTGTYTQYQNEDANRKAAALGGGAKPLVSGNLTYTAKDNAEDSQALNASRGTDGYVDPALYQKLYDAWNAHGGLLEDFLKAYPPKNYVNPANNWLPPYLRAPKANDVFSNL